MLSQWAPSATGDFISMCPLGDAMLMKHESADTELSLYPGILIHGSVNPRPAGGGRNGPPPCTFPSIAQKQKGVGLRNFREPLPTSILHMLTKGKFRTYDRSAVNDVRVTSCSAILGQK